MSRLKLAVWKGVWGVNLSLQRQSACAAESSGRIKRPGAGLGTNEILVNALTDCSLGPIDDNMQSILTFAGKLTLEPGKISAVDIDAVRAAGWRDQAIEDVIGVVATFAFLNRLVDGFGIEGTEDHFRQVGSMVSQQGYAPLVQMIEHKAAVHQKQ